MGGDMLNAMKYISTVPFSGLFNWSVQYLNDSKIAFSKAYPMMRIGDFLKRNKTAVAIEDDKTYKRATIKVRNGGIFLRDEEIGSKIGTKNQFLISKGQFLLSKIDARNGAFGVVPEVLDGGVITGNFWTFDVDYSIINPHYLALLTTTDAFIQFCEQASNGTTNRHYLQEPLFLNIKVPVPSLEEQNKLVEEYNNVVNVGHSRFSEGLIKAREAQVYLSESIGVQELHPNGAKDEIVSFEIVSFQKIQEWGADKILCSKVYESSKYETKTLNSDKSLYYDIKRGKSPKYVQDANVYILNQKCVRWNSIELQYAKSIDAEWLQSIDKDCLTREGDILINSTGEGTIGRSALIDKSMEGLLYDSHILLLRLNKEKIDPRFFVYVFNSRYGQEQVENVKSAKTTKQTELGIDNLKKIQIPIPPLNVQKQIVSELEVMYNEISDLQHLSPHYDQALKNFEAQIFE